MNESLSRKLGELPDRPGVYLYRDTSGRVVYVGKARSLRQRVRSYFQRSAAHPAKTLRLLDETADLEIIVTDTELEALMLENHLIKKEQPRYNVILRDDKNYPFLKLTVRDVYPRVELVRRARSDGNLYFGPYLPASIAWRTLRMIPKFFRVAICHVKFDGKQRPCLYWHLGQCLAPCAGYTNPGEYGEAVAEARMFLEGKTSELVADLTGKMERAAGEENFELAAHYRDLLASVRAMAERQGMSSTGLEDIDVFAEHREGSQVALQLFQMREGRVQSRREFFFESVEEDPAAFYATVLAQHYAADPAPPPVVCLPVVPADAPLIEEWLREKTGRAGHLVVPQRGRRRRLLALVRRNAKLAFDFRFRSEHGHGVEVLDALKDALGLEAPPYRIECFDISMLQGTDQVASMVVWEGGKPRKSDYRRFRVRTVEGADDFRSIAEVVGRRYGRLLREEKRLPDLVLIDGGKGQLSSAVAALDQLGLGEVQVASIAKREEEIFVEGRGAPILLPRESAVLQLVQRIRDEAHRFAITYHRTLRRARTLRSELTEIPGVGPVIAAKLLRAFGSVEGVREAGADVIAERFGPRIARAVAGHFASPEREPSQTPP